MSKGVKEIDRGEPLGLNPVDFCATCARLATLQTKVYVYEKIIANSNFAPMVQAMKTPCGARMEVDL